jgi:16S rRNA (guanine527-N7)-methyltransferase
MEKLKAGAKRLGITLDDGQLKQFQVYYEELVDWNQRFNLTAITEYDGVQISHFLDALTVVLAWQPAAGARVIDVGTGAGIPGLPLKIAFPQIHLTLLEATGKKVNFLRHVVDKLQLKDVSVVPGRSEDMAQNPRYREQYELALARGLAKMVTLAELTLPFCRRGGMVMAHKRGDISQELAQAQKAIQMCGGKLKLGQPVDLPEFPDNRVLVVLEKVSPTPKIYPRQPGMPGKSPLGEPGLFTKPRV